jgi:hypothetical protein
MPGAPSGTFTLYTRGVPYGTPPGSVRHIS